jgi:hypothetical protein
MKLTDDNFLVCKKCGKKLIKYLPSGLFQFMWGRGRDENGDFSSHCPVEIQIHGQVQMKCTAKGCDCINTFSAFDDFRKGVS